jgi:hypothetical protein
VHVCVSVHLDTCLCVYMYMCVCISDCVCAYLCVCVCVRGCTFGCEYTDMHGRVEGPHFDAAIRLAGVIDETAYSAYRGLRGGGGGKER